jgi:hypothetical protein
VNYHDHLLNQSFLKNSKQVLFYAFLQEYMCSRELINNYIQIELTSLYQYIVSSLLLE